MNSKVKLIILSLAIIFVSTTRTVFGDAQSPPEFTKSPDDDGEILLSAKADRIRPFLIPCEATGHPTPSYFWTKNGQLFNWTTLDDRIVKIPGKGTLIINRREDSDFGEYQCFAENIWGIATSNSVFVRKTDLESFKEGEVAVQQVIEGQPFGLTCQAPDGYPKPKAYWIIKDSIGQFFNINNSRITLDPKGTLWFSNTTLNDTLIEGSVYSCAATSLYLGYVTIGNQVKLEVIPKNSSSEQSLIAPVKQYTSQKIEVVISDDKVFLYCIFGGKPLPNTTWYKNDELIQFRDNISLANYGKVVEIKHVTSADEGNYTCQVSNGVGDPISHTTNLKVLAKPTFTKKPTNANKAEDETVEFHCEAAGNPTPEITWIHNGKPLSEAPFNPRRVVSPTSIIIEKLQKNDTGNYGCKAINSLGYVYQDVYVNVLVEPPKITESSARNEEVVEAGTMVLRCHATGWPKPRITWNKNGAEVFGNRISISDNGDLTITKVSFSDMGNYTCSAQNKIATVNTSVNLVVRKRTLIRPGNGPSDTTVQAGKLVTFRCSFEKDPELEADLYWLRNGKYIYFESQQHFFQANDNSLIIKTANKQDSGTYTCSVVTSVDKATAEATLVVQDAP